jgi:DNA-binding MarR family transcriptional regulator
MKLSRQDILRNIEGNMSQVRKLMFSSLLSCPLEKDMPTPAQMGIMILLEETATRQVSTQDFAKRLRISTPAITQLITALIKKKLVKRTANQKDARKIVLTITPKGKKQLVRVKKIHDELFSRIFEPLSEQELLILDTLQKKILRGLHADENHHQD